MAADPLQTFAPGDSIGSLKATTANAWTEAARQARKSARTGGEVVGYRQRPGALEVMVQNDTGADLDVRDVVQVSFPLLYPTTYVDDLQREPAFLGIMPTSASGTPAVLIEPIPDGTTGRAVIMGVAHVVVDITDAAHTSAKIKVGETGYLTSAAAGAGTATILWRETGTGQKLCCVLLCCADGDPAIGDNPDWVFESGGEVTTACCDNSIPTTLYVTVSGGGGSHALTWDSGVQQWVSAEVTVTGCGVMQFRFYCDAGTFKLSADQSFTRVGGPDCWFDAVSADSVSGCTAADLTSATFTATPSASVSHTCDCTAAKTFTVTP